MAQKMCLQCGVIGNTKRFMKGAVPNASRVPKCVNAKDWDGTYFQGLNFQRWGAWEIKIAAGRRFGNKRPALNPFPFSSPAVFCATVAVSRLAR